MPIFVLIALLLLCTPSIVFAQSGSQKSTTALDTEVGNLFADNTAGAITPFDVRQVFVDIIASYPNLVNGSPVTFSGSITANDATCWSATGVVKDCPKSGNTNTFATANGALTNGHCVSIDANGNFVDAGGACTTGGGGGTVSSGTSGQVAYYTSTGTTVGGATLALPMTITSGSFKLNLASPLTTISSNLSLNLASPLTVTSNNLSLSFASPLTITSGNLTFNTSGNTTTVGTTSGSLVSGDCAKFDASGNIVDNGSTCGSGGGGSGTVNSGTKSQIGIYNSAGTAISGQTFAAFVSAYGAVCDGSTDDTTAFQNALNAINSAGGGMLYIPPSTSGCVVASGPLTYSGQHLRVTGSGLNSQILKTNSTGDLFQFSGLQEVQVDHISINGGSASSGVLLNFTNTSSNAGNNWVHDVFLTGGFDQIAFAGGQNDIVADSSLQFFKERGIHYGTGYTGAGFLTNIMMNTTANTGFGIHVESGDGFLWNNLNIFGAATGVYIHPSASGFVRNMFVNNTFSDTSSTGNNWTFDGSASGAFIERINFTNTWAGGASAGDGFYLQDVREFSCINCRSIDNGGQGFHLTGTNVGIKLIGGTAEGNSLASNGTYDGIRVDNGTSHLLISGMRSGPSSSEFVNNSQKYGLDFTGGSVNDAEIVNNDFSGNITASINAAPTGSSNRIEANIGYNPVGGSGISVGASPFLYINGPTPATVYIAGGTVTGLSTNGVTVWSGVNLTGLEPFNLGPNEAVQVTYSSAPLMYTSVH